ncbi:DUF4097 family beta strand repeat-containing protein [Longimicrobium sp.]|uniref:DUF4097 family beta strand repeat-containing protein n=1 Tax=Longimicrobium sp. TaxID=2029185 RepID=UPI003B3B42BE
MRYAAVVAASAAVVGTLVFARDGRSEAAPVLAAAAAQTVPARLAQQQPAARAASQEDFRWAGRLARGQQIEIRGIVGDVRAEVASGDQVEVVGRRSGDEADRVRIEVVEGADGVVICAIYPASGRGGSGNGGRRRTDACDNNNGQGGEIDAEDARIDFTVRVPAGVKFASRTVAGDVNATGLRSAVDVATVSGDVTVSTTGTARAATVSGDVTATFGETDGEDMDFASVSGNVILRLAGNVGAEVSAQTLSGEIESDFDLRMRGEDEDDDDGFHIEIGSAASGTIGRGGPELNVNTVSGDIRLERVR